ncbi:hypothetical protein EPO33_01185 [Patescibacteria group bacterium]|nr:MAG: hypothetical protein EPO33_01185 [Patescibacteria group bacterium]
MNHRARNLAGIVVATVIFTCFQVFLQWTQATERAARPTQLGVTFAPSQARYLGQDPERTFRLLLDEIGVRHFRLSAYWNASEAESGTYDFSEIDWQVAEAERRGATVVLAVGRRLPRWPECHDPGWLAGLDPTEVREAQLAYVRAAVEHLRGSSAIIAWQVENEPFLHIFGTCPPPDKKLLEQEIALVRSLDNRPVVITESGELSTWRYAAALGDAVGISMYRITYTPLLGYYPYLFTPNFYTVRADLIALLTGKRTMVTELQMEPWLKVGITESTVAEMYRSLSPEQFNKNARYARAAGLSPMYLWGAEWWLWMKEENNVPEFWDAAKTLFRS